MDFYDNSSHIKFSGGVASQVQKLKYYSGVDELEYSFGKFKKIGLFGRMARFFRYRVQWILALCGAQRFVIFMTTAIRANAYST